MRIFVLHVKCQRLSLLNSYEFIGAINNFNDSDKHSVLGYLDRVQQAPINPLHGIILYCALGIGQGPCSLLNYTAVQPNAISAFWIGLC